MKLKDEHSPHPELAPMDMHGPVEVSITVFAKTESGVGRMTFTHPSGLIPTQLELASYLDVAREEAGKTNAVLPTKAEFVAHVTKRETGLPIPMENCGDFIPVEVPDGH